MSVSDENGEVSDEGELLIVLQGRIVALERIIVGLMAQAGAQMAEDPEEGVEMMRRALFASQQNATRDIGDYVDAVWSEAVKAMENTFANAAKRARQGA